MTRTFFSERMRDLRVPVKNRARENAGRGNRVNKMFLLCTPSAMKEQIIQATGIRIDHLVQRGRPPAVSRDPLPLAAGPPCPQSEKGVCRRGGATS